MLPPPPKWWRWGRGSGPSESGSLRVEDGDRVAVDDVGAAEQGGLLLLLLPPPGLLVVVMMSVFVDVKDSLLRIDVLIPV